MRLRREKTDRVAHSEPELHEPTQYEYVLIRISLCREPLINPCPERDSSYLAALFSSQIPRCEITRVGVEVTRFLVQLPEIILLNVDLATENGADLLVYPEGNIPYQSYDGFSQAFYDSESPLSLHTDEADL